MDEPLNLMKISDTSSQGIFAKFIFGYFGLPITFWLLGVLPALGFDYSATLVTLPWQWLTLASLALVHACIIPIATWNAATKYEGMKLWSVLAKILAVLSVIKWSVLLPSYISAFFKVVKLV